MTRDAKKPTATGVTLLDPIAATFIYIALVAWLITFVAMLAYPVRLRVAH